MFRECQRYTEFKVLSIHSAASVLDTIIFKIKNNSSNMQVLCES